jgi:hypothetical protein
MPFIVGGLAAIVALAAGILSKVDPVATIWRASLAFLLGWVGTQVWYVFFTVQKSEESAESVGAEPLNAGGKIP